jgi:hypothetical protein
VNVDEMDLIGELKDAAPLRPGAYEQARTMLRAAMTESGNAFPRGRSRRTSKAGIGAGIGAVAAAAAAAIALVVTQAPRPAATATASAGPASQAPATGSPLVSLAAVIKASGGSLPGDASLVIRTQTIGTRPPDVSYNLYVDSGAFYGGGDKNSLQQAVARHEDDAGGIDAAEVAAARYAAAGDLATARKQMVNATPNWFALGLGPAAQKAAWEKAMAKAWPILKQKGVKTPPKQPTGQALQDDIDNYVWNNSVDALSAGAGNPAVRAGVLRLLSTIPEVSVAKSATGGQPTLTLTAESALFGGGVEQVLTINARTGMPIRSVMNAQGNVPSSVSTYQVSRVTLADIRAGMF